MNSLIPLEKSVKVLEDDSLEMRQVKTANCIGPNIDTVLDTTFSLQQLVELNCLSSDTQISSSFGCQHF